MARDPEKPVGEGAEVFAISLTVAPGALEGRGGQILRFQTVPAAQAEVMIDPGQQLLISRRPVDVCAGSDPGDFGSPERAHLNMLFAKARQSITAMQCPIGKSPT